MTTRINPAQAWPFRPPFVAGTRSTVDGTEYGADLYQDGTVRIVVDGEEIGSARFVATSTESTTADGIRCVTVDARIVDVPWFIKVPSTVVDSLAQDLVFFTHRAGRFGKVA